MRFNCLLSLVFNRNAKTIPILINFLKDAFSSPVKVPQDKVSIKGVRADTCEPGGGELSLLSEKGRRLP